MSRSRRKKADSRPGDKYLESFARGVVSSTRRSGGPKPPGLHSSLSTPGSSPVGRKPAFLGQSPIPLIPAPYVGVNRSSGSQSVPTLGLPKVIVPQEVRTEGLLHPMYRARMAHLDPLEEGGNGRQPPFYPPASRVPFLAQTGRDSVSPEEDARDTPYRPQSPICPFLGMECLGPMCMLYERAMAKCSHLAIVDLLSKVRGETRAVGDLVLRLLQELREP